jgi:hypothetical protein
MLMFSLNAQSYAWHENLGIDANKAAELYQTKPNDPAIVKWKNALQLAINDVDKCLDLQSAISCELFMSTIIGNCKSHPNELLACNDARLVKYLSVLKTAEEIEEQRIQAAQQGAEQRNQSRLKFQECIEKGGSAMTC